MKTEKFTLEIVNSSQEYFYKVINQKFRERSLTLSNEAEFYIVNLLNHFVKTENLYGINQDGTKEDKPLAFLLKEAEDELDFEPKRLLFRQVGDLALYTIGVFPNKKVSGSYYGMMGKTGYSNAAKYYKNNNMREICQELSFNFERIAFLLRGIPQLTVQSK
jgi:hypothetical protein